MGTPVVVRVWRTGVRTLALRALLVDFGTPSASSDAFFLEIAERRWLAVFLAFALARIALCLTVVAVEGFESSGTSPSGKDVLATDTDEVADMFVMGTAVSHTSLKGRLRISSGTVRIILSYHKSTLRQILSVFSCMAKRELSRVHSSSLTIHSRYFIWSGLKAFPWSRDDWRGLGFFVRGISGGRTATT